MMQRSMIYGFPEAVLDAGEERTVSIELKEPFRPEKLVLIGRMNEIRGHFKVKRSRLPLLNRDDVVAYSRVYKCRRGKKIWFRKGKTTVEFLGTNEHKSFVRKYLSSSVVYNDVDPLDYIILRNMFCDKEVAMASTDGIPAQCFSSESYGNALSLPTSEVSLSLRLKNEGDIRVSVYASFTGRGWSV